jgi:excisionase family DNA binding protein
MDEELLTARESASRLGITERHFSRLRRQGTLPLAEYPSWPGAQRRFRAAEVDALADKLAAGVVATVKKARELAG